MIISIKIQQIFCHLTFVKKQITVFMSQHKSRYVFLDKGRVAQNFEAE